MRQAPLFLSQRSVVWAGRQTLAWSWLCPLNHADAVFFSSWQLGPPSSPRVCSAPEPHEDLNKVYSRPRFGRLHIPRLKIRLVVKPQTGMEWLWAPPWSKPGHKIEMEDYLPDSEIPKTLNCFNHSWFCCLEYYMYKSVCMRCTEEKLLLHAYVYSNLFNSKYVFIQTNYAYMYIYILISHITTHKRNFKSLWKTFLRNGVFMS